jgi:hypothetical protein
MALRIILKVGDNFYIDDIKICVTECSYIGNKIVAAIFKVYYPSGAKNITVNAHQEFEVIASAFIKICPAGSATRSLLTITVQAPEEIYIKREGYTPKANLGSV